MKNLKNTKSQMKTKNYINNDFSKITNFLRTSSHIDIKNKLYDILYKSDFNDIILGTGTTGKVSAPAVNRYENIRINKTNLYIKIPTAIKTPCFVEQPDLDFTIHNGILYISSIFNLTSETLILMFTNELWSKNPHLPYLIGYSCFSQNNKNINKVIIHKYGLDKEYIYDYTPNIIPDKVHYKYNDTSCIFKSRISTLHQLLKYCYYVNKNHIKLPNNNKCKFIKMYDYISISFFATYEFLTKHNIFVEDLWAHNIFIHWLNKNSYYGDINISNVKYIIYKINNKYYKIETYGFIIILGDIGISKIKIRDNVILLGHKDKEFVNYKDINQQLTNKYRPMDLIYGSEKFLRRKYFDKTIASKILEIEPYYSSIRDSCDYFNNRMEKEFLLKSKTPKELLEFYNKYEITKDDIKLLPEDNVIIIEI